MADLQLRPERLLPHAAAASALSEELRAVLCGAPADGGVHAGELERLRGVAGGAVRELAELGSVLGAAAAAGLAADAEVAEVLARLRAALGPA